MKVRDLELRDVATHPGAVGILWKWLCARHREPFVNISHRRMPTLEQHQLFVRGHPYWHWWILRANEPSGIWADVGEMRLGRDNSVGIFIAPEYRRQGYAHDFLGELLTDYSPLPALPGVRPGHFVANIHPANRASQDLFEQAGFDLVQYTYARKQP